MTSNWSHVHATPRGGRSFIDPIVAQKCSCEILVVRFDRVTYPSSTQEACVSFARSYGRVVSRKSKPTDALIFARRVGRHKQEFVRQNTMQTDFELLCHCLTGAVRTHMLLAFLSCCISLRCTMTAFFMQGPTESISIFGRLWLRRIEVVVPTQRVENGYHQQSCIHLHP